MSWDSYIDNLIANSKDSSGTIHADSACIIGLTGAKWTTDGHSHALKITPAEVSTIASTFTSKNFAPFQANGVLIEGAKYQFLRELDGKIVLAKKKGSGALTMQTSKTAVIIAHCPEGGQQGYTNKAVDTIAQYLESLNI